MKRLIAVGVFGAMCTATAVAHVPYLERIDYSSPRPYQIDDVEQSIALYSWLESDSDIDYHVFELTDPKDLFVEVIVPVCPEYAQFLPSYAVIGPGLPQPAEPLPVPVPDGYGAIVVPNLPPGEPRDSFYEPFGGKSYYTGVVLRERISTSGTWMIIVWDDYETVGDYVLTVGEAEIWPPKDILRALVNTPLIRQDRELHSDCADEVASTAPAAAFVESMIPKLPTSSCSATALHMDAETEVHPGALHVRNTPSVDAGSRSNAALDPVRALDSYWRRRAA